MHWTGKVRSGMNWAECVALCLSCLNTIPCPSPLNSHWLCPISHTFFEGYLFWVRNDVHLQTLKKFILHSMNVCSLNVIWMYYIDHVVNVMWPASISCVTCPVASWDTEGCALHNLGGSSRPFRYPIHTVLYCKYGNATLLAYGFSLTIVENFECSLSLEETWMKERLFQSLWDFINLLGGCNDSQFLPWGGELHHLMDLVCFWASYMLEERQPPSPKNSQLTQTPLSPTYSLTVVFLFFSSKCVGL